MRDCNIAVRVTEAQGGFRVDFLEVAFSLALDGTERLDAETVLASVAFPAGRAQRVFPKIHVGTEGCTAQTFYCFSKETEADSESTEDAQVSDDI